MKFLGVKWFSGHGTVGIVRVKCPYEGLKYYFGVASGKDEDEDIESIMAWGATFPKQAGDQLFGIKE